MLAYLVEHAGQLVRQDQLLEALWSETYVNPEVLRKYILEIRKILGDQPGQPEFIETVPRRGYRFISPVTEESGIESRYLVEPREPPDELDEKEELTAPVVGVVEKPSRKRLSWKHGAVAIALLVIVASIGIGSHFGSAREERKDTSIAVLPFVDLSPARDQEYFSDGLSDQLIQDLARISGLKVVGRSSAFQFKGKNEDLREVGRKLGVANVLEGSVRREGNRVRVTAELIKTADGFQLWSQTYDRDTADIFAVQDEISSATSRALQLKLLESGHYQLASTLHAVGPDAYEAYLKGKFLSGRGETRDDLKKALAYATTSITLDPEYAQAWALRASVQNMMATLALINPIDGFRKARHDAEKAIALDPGTASAYIALATTQMYYDWDYEAASASLDRASALEPGSADILRIRAHLSMILGDLDQSIRLDEEAVSGDPLRANSYLLLGQLFYSARRYNDATTALQKALDLNPHITYAHLALGQILLAKQMPQQALAEVNKESTDWGKLIGEALVYHALGRAQNSDAALAELVARHSSDAAYQIAEVYAFRGDPDKSLEWLERSFEQKDGGLSGLKTDPLLRAVRHDRRYTKLLTALHLAP